MVHGRHCVESQFTVETLLVVWRNFRPPIRPSIVHQRVYADYLARLSAPETRRVLVLGVTPELRALAAAHRCRVTAIDLHSVMIRAMAQLMDADAACPRVEDVVKGNWLTLPFRDAAYDLILGDCVINALTIGETRVLLAELRRVLRRDRQLCLRAMTCPRAGPHDALQVFARHRRTTTRDRAAIFRDLYGKLLCSREAYDLGTRRSSVSRMRDTWRALFRRRLITPDEYRAFEDVLATGEYRPTLLPRADLEALLTRHFQVLTVEGREDDDPVYCLTTR